MNTIWATKYQMQTISLKISKAFWWPIIFILPPPYLYLQNDTKIFPKLPYDFNFTNIIGGKTLNQIHPP